MKKVIATTNAPAAVGPYSQAIEANGFLFGSGQIPLDPATGKLVEGGIKEQTARVLKNIDAVLTEAGYTKESVIKTTILLQDIADFAEVNEVYSGYFTAEQPARSTYQVAALPLGARIEIEIIAAK
ncbi:MAG: RidA family protein [Rikenellaceae bacterium]